MGTMRVSELLVILSIVVHRVCANELVTLRVQEAGNTSVELSTVTEQPYTTRWHLVFHANDTLRIQEAAGNATVDLSVTAQPNATRWERSMADVLYTCEATVSGSNSVWRLGVEWLPPEGLQRSDYGNRWKETHFTTWQGQQLTNTTTLTLKNLVPNDAGIYNCSVTYQPNVASSSYHVWTETRLVIYEPYVDWTVWLLAGISAGIGVVMVVAVVACALCLRKRRYKKRKKRPAGRVTDRTLKSFPKGENLSKHAPRDVPERNSMKSPTTPISIPASVIGAEETSKHRQEATTRPKKDRRKKVQETFVGGTETTKTCSVVILSEQQSISEISSANYSSIAPIPRTSPVIEPPEKNMASEKSTSPTKNASSTKAKQNTSVVTVEQTPEQHCHFEADKGTKIVMPHEDKTTGEDRVKDLQFFDKLYSEFSNLTEEDINAMCIQLQTNYSSTNFAAGVFDDTGGHLSLPRHDINLFIPPGAIEAGQLKTIHIFVPPGMNCGKPAPIVHCGPTGTTFADHVVLFFPVDPNHAEIVPKFTNTEVGAEEEWQPLFKDDGAASIVANGKCTLFLSHFTGFGAEAKESADNIGADDKKIIRVGAFAAEQTSDNRLYKLRIRFYDASSDARERIYTTERNLFGGRLIDDDRRMQVDRRGGNLCVMVGSIAAGWRAVDSSDEDQRIGLGQLWDCQHDTDASCTVRLEKMNPQAPLNDIWSTVSVWQEKTHGQTITLKPSDTLQMFPRSDTSVLGDGLSVAERFLRQQEELRPTKRPFPNLPLDVRHEMCVLLDVGLPGGNDWRMMAERFGIDSPTISWIGRNKSPTSKLLDFWETENVSGGTVALQRLCELFEEIGRPDVKQLVENILSSDDGMSTWSGVTSNGSLASDMSIISESCQEDTCVMTSQGSLRDSGYEQSDTMSTSTCDGSPCTLNQSVVSVFF
ncbi:UNC5C [Branchiostoma lanceolatum]|uniref:Netrin receptor UNC5 n=1 Tax=Branchiostoma lanceolatum TaxID=7740 RepID=A0A8J9VIA4_BRALA|nr:UNC5C [Branchiostoma lanceolatum]